MTLIVQVLIECFKFTFFFVCWLTLFSLLNRTAGVEVDVGDYKNLNVYVYYFIQLFRSTIGDIKIPVNQFWDDNLSEHPNISSMMIAWAWLLWATSQYFMMIILLNFLIAIISQTYDAVIAKTLVIMY